MAMKDWKKINMNRYENKFKRIALDVGKTFGNHYRVDLESRKTLNPLKTFSSVGDARRFMRKYMAKH